MARIDARSIPASTPSTFNAACPPSIIVGNWVYITGPKSAGLYQVALADPTSPTKIPAAGVVISKPTSSTAVVQWGGAVPAGVIGSIAPARVCYVGPAGTTVASPPSTLYVQIVGTTIDTGELILEPVLKDLPVPSYVSHFNTNDGIGDCRLSDNSTTARNVSSPAGHFDIGSWTPGTAHNTTRTSTWSYSTTMTCSVLNLTTTLTARLLGADGITIVAQNSLVLTGNATTTSNGITLTASGWSADYDKYKAKLDISFNLPTILPSGGRFSINLTHTNGSDGTFTKTQNDIFYDNETTPPSLSGVAVSESSKIMRFLSGVEYYDLGSQFQVSIADIDWLNDESYPTNQVNAEGTEYGLPALALPGSSLTAWTNAWSNQNASYLKTNWAITQVDLTVKSTTANIRARTKDWTDGTWVNSPNQSILIETHDDPNTRLIERFYYEDWRCYQTADFDLPAARGWNGSVDNGATDALYYAGGCEHNALDWRGYSPDPTTQPDYTAHSGRQYLVREFQHDGSASSGFTLGISGTYATLEYKLAKAWDGTATGGTVWINGQASYSAALWSNGNPLGGSGGLAGTLHFSLGTNNIVNTSNTLYVRVGLDVGQRITGPLTVTFD
jgi:hypothetical protein